MCNSSKRQSDGALVQEKMGCRSENQERRADAQEGAGARACEEGWEDWHG